NSDGAIVLGNAAGGLLRVSAAGGQPAALTTPDASRSHRWPSFLPDGNHFLYLAGPPWKLYAGSLDSSEPREIMSVDTKVLYSPPGYLLFVRQGNLMAQPFDAARLTLTGDAFPVAENVRTGGGNARAAFSVSENGVLTYRTGGTAGNNQLAWFDRSGKRLDVLGPVEDFRGIHLAPDEKRVAVHRHEGEAGGDIWIIEQLRGTMSRFTFNSALHHTTPLWSPDGTRMAFTVHRNTPGDIYIKSTSGAGSEELVFESKENKLPRSWSADGRFILFENTDPKTQSDLWVLPTTGDRKPFVFLQTEFNEMHAQFSPDGRWVAYTSNESGARQEVYVQSFPPSRGKWLVSTNGGAWPHWSRNGKELFFLGPDQKLFVVDVKVGATTLDVGIPKPLFETQTVGGANHPYCVSNDAQRFLITSVEMESSQPITVLLLARPRGRARVELERATRSVSLANTSGSTLIATSRSSLVSCARYTSPIPPAPSRAETS
ncbi:MAG: PD40 domain-containing protein, partial [Acidobacteria bacterium]|nr:PD40 domain-containing protein [Acidobacteriota bacterium]